MEIHEERQEGKVSWRWHKVRTEYELHWLNNGFATTLYFRFRPHDSDHWSTPIPIEDPDYAVSPATEEQAKVVAYRFAEAW